MSRYSFGMIKPTNKRNEVIENVFAKGLDLVIQLVRTWPGFEVTAKKMQKIADNVINKLDAHCNQKTAGFKVLNHGDLWVNNLLFKYDKGVPVDLVFVDYQMSFYSSPGIDINYFLNTSPRLEVRQHSRDELIKSYYLEFSKTLKLLDDASWTTPLISLDEMKQEIGTREFFGFMASVGILPIVLMDKETAKDANMESLTCDETAAKMRIAMYNNPIYVQAMKYIVKRFDKYVDFGTIV